MIQKELIRIKVEDLVPYERNPRKIPQEAVDDVRESYKQCGVIDPIEIDEENVILSGHTRRLAAIEEGIKEVDALRVSGLTEPQKRKYRLLANKTGEKSGWDYELLDWELEDLDFEGYDFGFDLPEEFTAAEEEDRKGNMADKYLVPPFSVIYANKPDWLARKRAWVSMGLHSEVGRGGKTCLQFKEQSRGKLPTEIRGGGEVQSLQEQRTAKRIHDRSKAYADGLIARREEIRRGK